MSEAAAYGKKIKAFYAKLKKSATKDADAGKPRPMVEELIFAILAREATDEQAERALRALLDNTVDLNELRVTTPKEMVAMMGGRIPDAIAKAQEINDVLNEIVRREDKLDLTVLKPKKVREAREYLETLGSLSPFAAAWFLCNCLGGHAIPVDDTLIVALRDDDLVPADADLPEIQALLERYISASDAKKHPALLRQFALAHAGKRKSDTSKSKSKSTAKKKKTKSGKAATSGAKTASKKTKTRDTNKKRAKASAR